MPPPAHAQTAENVVLQVKSSANAGMAILENLGARMDLARGESFEGIKHVGFIKKQNIRLMFSVINIIIMLLEWFESDGRSSRMSLLISGIFIYPGRVCSQFLEENTTWFDLLVVLLWKPSSTHFH